MKRPLRKAFVLICVFGSVVLFSGWAAPLRGQERPAQASPAKKAPQKPRPINPADVGGTRGMGAILRGAVVDRSGVNLPGSSVKAISSDDPQRQWDVTTDASGRFQISDLPVGTYTLEASRQGARTGRYVGLRLDSLLCSVRIQLLPGPAEQVITTHFVELRGRVVEGNGNPVPEAQVEFKGPAFAKPLAVLTDSDGEFRIPNFQSGVYGVRVHAAGFIPEEQAALEIAAPAGSVPVTMKFVVRKID